MEVMNRFKKKKIQVTTSWDDGSPGDLKMRDLLYKYGLSGTFYIPVKNYERPVMANKDIMELATGFEIGSHTYHHRVLPGLSNEEMKKEIVMGKDFLEQLLGQDIPCFCYPKGKFNRRVIRCVEEVGIKAARTTLAFKLSGGANPFSLETSLQAFSETRSVHLKHALKEFNFLGAFTYITKLHLAADWKELAIKLFDMAVETGGVWHLWGHSWEVEEYGLWEELEQIFQYVAGREAVHYVSNGQLVDASE